MARTKREGQFTSWRVSQCWRRESRSHHPGSN